MQLPGKNLYNDPKVKKLLGTKPMLSGLDVLLYQHIRKAIKDAFGDLPPYNPYLYESHLTDVSKLLDRCLANRRECADLEAQAIRRALEFDLFEATLPHETHLQELLTSTDALDKQKTAQEEAAKQFGTASPMNQGMEALSRLGATAVGATATNKSEIRKVMVDRLALLKEHQERVSRPATLLQGTSLNYVERRERAINFHH